MNEGDNRSFCLLVCFETNKQTNKQTKRTMYVPTGLVETLGDLQSTSRGLDPGVKLSNYNTMPI
jgi:hypothetical protein